MVKRWGITFVLICAFASVCVSLWTADPDVFWHLKVGEWIVENHAVPETDIYSWMAYGRPWIAHEWLWEAVMYLVYGKMGVAGLWALVLVSGAATGLLIRSGVKGTGQVASVAGGAAPLLLVGWLKPWPQAGVYALFSAYLYLSLRGRWGRREIVSIAAVGLIWANIHSSAVMLPFLLLAEAGWRVIAKEKGVKPLLFASAASALTTLINPHGPWLWFYVIKESIFTEGYRAYIVEWMPFYFGSTEMAASFFICAAVLFFSAHRGKIRSLEFSRAAGFWALALLSRIYMPYAVLSTAALLGTLKVEFSKNFIKKLAVIVVLAVGVALWARGIPPDLDTAAEKSRFPVTAVGFLQDQHYKRVFNDYGFGGYLIWKGVPVYIDGRAELYKYKGIFREYMGLPEAGGISRYVAGTGADAALVLNNSLLDHALGESPRWRLIYRDETAAVYEPALY